LFVAKTRLVTTRLFWVSEAIIVFFQLISNGFLTGLNIVRYSGSNIVGTTSPETGAPSFLGNGRIAFAPIEDLFFGFALVLATLIFWVAWGRAGVQRNPVAGPPRGYFARNRRATK
jgi:hypothetical protein